MGYISPSDHLLSDTHYCRFVYIKYLTILYNTQYTGGMKTDKETLIPTEALVQELRRGTVVMAAMTQLYEPQYGYSLLKRLADKGFEVDQGTLYPMLRRLEGNGLLESDWIVEGSRPRRYYKLSPLGKETLASLTKEWQALVAVLNQLILEEEKK
jgi:DNA-binding PadR family transcriptional regulator